MYARLGIIHDTLIHRRFQTYTINHISITTTYIELFDTQEPPTSGVPWQGIFHSGIWSPNTSPMVLFGCLLACGE